MTRVCVIVEVLGEIRTETLHAAKWWTRPSGTLVVRGREMDDPEAHEVTRAYSPNKWDAVSVIDSRDCGACGAF